MKTPVVSAFLALAFLALAFSGRPARADDEQEIKAQLEQARQALKSLEEKVAHLKAKAAAAKAAAELEAAKKEAAKKQEKAVIEVEIEDAPAGGKAINLLELFLRAAKDSDKDPKAQQQMADLIQQGMKIFFAPEGAEVVENKSATTREDKHDGVGDHRRHADVLKAVLEALHGQQPSAGSTEDLRGAIRKGLQTWMQGGLAHRHAPAAPDDLREAISGLREDVRSLRDEIHGLREAIQAAARK